jgi:hypothetical protein
VRLFPRVLSGLRLITHVGQLAIIVGTRRSIGLGYRKTNSCISAPPRYNVSISIADLCHLSEGNQLALRVELDPTGSLTTRGKRW